MGSGLSQEDTGLTGEINDATHTLVVSKSECYVKFKLVILVFIPFG